MTAALQINEISDRLLQAGADQAVERGTTNAAINAPTAVASAQRDAIAARRASGDAALAHAFERIGARPMDAERRSLLAAAQESHARLKQLRATIDSAIAPPGRALDAETLRGWFPAATRNIMAIQALRLDVEQEVRAAGIKDGMAVKHALWEVSEFAGQERGFMAGVIAAGRPLAAGEIARMGTARGRVESAWTLAWSKRAGFGDAVAKALDTAQDVYFTSFERVRTAVYGAATASNGYPFSAEDWFKRSTAGIDSVLAAQRALTDRVSAVAGETVDAATWRFAAAAGILAIAAMALAVGTLVTLRQVLAPLSRMTACMGRLAQGDLTVAITDAGRRDEIGPMAAALAVFKRNAEENKALLREQDALKSRAEADRRSLLATLAQGLDAKVRAVVDALTASTQELDASAASVASIAEETNAEARAVAATSSEAGQSVQTVAAATEELTATIASIGREVESAQTVANAARQDVGRSRAVVGALNEASGRIGDVVGIINAIASQTNLLALNATIEAARAGAAGSGFAVVANEVKALAAQTGRATEDIREEIAKMQGAITAAADAMQGFGAQVTRVSEANGIIASAVEEQSATAHEIASAVAAASSRVQDVVSRIGAVTGATGQTSAATTQIKASAAELARQATVLREAVAQFLAEVQAALSRRGMGGLGSLSRMAHLRGMNEGKPRTTATRRDLLRAAAALPVTIALPWGRASAAPDVRIVAAPARATIVGKPHPDTDVWAYNGSVPGPELRFKQGERARITFENGLPQASTVHWHGLRLPNAMDGVPGLTQAPVEPGGRFVYEFDLKDAGTFWYHPHLGSAEQLGRGLSGAFVVEESDPPTVDRELTWVLSDWRLDAQARIEGDFLDLFDVTHAGRLGNTVTLNGRVPDRVAVRAGERLRLRLVNVANARIFSLDFGALRPQVIAFDGHGVAPHAPAGGRVALGPGMRVDLILDVDAAPGAKLPIIDRANPNRAFRVVDLVAGAKPFRRTPLQDAVALPANPLPEPDLGTATRQEITLGGGMGGMMMGRSGQAPSQEGSTMQHGAHQDASGAA
ncbi:MAG: multicopper oxidase domain-containing protein, partial [Alphaproteobacteria bacterium]|nr:multicopper oxidase domain-containing protein [Alphaproteobacteria bacterium]